MKGWKGHPRDSKQKLRKEISKRGKGWQPLCGVKSPPFANSVHEYLVSHFVKQSAWLWFFCLIHGNATESPGENFQEGIMNQRSCAKFQNPPTSKVNDMHLIPVSPNKAVTEWFHTLVSSGLPKEKRGLLLQIWVFQSVVFVVVIFSPQYLFVQTQSFQGQGFSNMPLTSVSQHVS